MSEKVRRLSCLLVGYEMWGVLFNMLRVDYMYSCHNRQKFQQQLSTQLSSKAKTFSQTFIACFEAIQSFLHLEENITFITLIFRELLIPKNAVTWMPESSCFRTPFGSRRVKGCQTLLKSARQQFYVNFSFMSNKVGCVSCLFVGSEMWGGSFNTWTADDMYSWHKREKFPQQVPIYLLFISNLFTVDNFR